MELLPSLRWSGKRWWLPLGDSTANSLAAIWLDDQPSAANRQLTQRIIELLADDPALLCFCVVQFSRTRDTNETDSVTVVQLARWFQVRAMRLFAVADSHLAAPAVLPRHRESWSKLGEACAMMPREQWQQTWAQWLAVLDGKPPRRWQARWPELIWSTKRRGLLPRPQIPRYANSSIPLVKLAEVVRDRTQLRHHFQTHLQAAKQSALRQFAYGLTHEINNPLANIVSRSEQVQDQLAEINAQPQRQSLGRVVQQAMRAHELLSDVMFYAHPPQPQIDRVELKALIECLLDEFRQRYAEQRIEFFAVNEQAIDCRADGEMMHDALQALLRNAAEAIGVGGRVQVAWQRQGPRVLIEVADSGPGLSAEATEHAFDPFFSGREAGRGLGLGLCRVYRIARLHGGGTSLRGGVAGCTARFWIADS